MGPVTIDVKPDGDDRGTPLEPRDIPHVDPDFRLADASGPIAEQIDLDRRVKFWRTAAGIAAAVAVAAVAVVVVDRLPQPPASDTGRYLSVLTADGALPAVLVDVDTARGLVTVRQIGAQWPAGANPHLWTVAEGGAPVLLGRIDPQRAVLRIRPDRAGVLPTRGSFAVSMEPTDAASGAAPSGAFLYRGPLVPLAD